MIGFFRKIRKQLADDNKPLKYMRYAIGEIVLVVVRKVKKLVNKTRTITKIILGITVSLLLEKHKKSNF
ncbi:MAG: hypothetical protein ABJJ25_13930 [Eudoraea sp.]|uniref:hypothetical protein n=1 Tax=Eudoraea sp. TaxID=1979955 RepID=UPI003264A363